MVRKKKRSGDFFLRGEHCVPQHSRKAKRGGNLMSLWKIVMISVT